ncbi:MAG: nucleotide-diphospho-sugar transferase [Cytophagales bacterium]|nr:nucleotide-diphospho-sugar transferase [Cytophagales bacterium]
MKQLDTPILFILFNRSDTAIQVLEAIRKVEPKKLYFFADAPRGNVLADSKDCEEARQIVRQVDWACEVKTNFLTQNVGPRKAIGQAIHWMFEHEDEGIILEHDCLPDPSFFWYCQQLLDYYRHDSRIMHISGDNFQNGIQRGEASYYFSMLNHIWGFATWKRAWKYYDVDMKKYPEFVKNKEIDQIIFDKSYKKYWIDIFNRIYDNRINSWDYQWTFAIWTQHGLSILPQKNLVSNIGFDEKALNTVRKKHRFANMKRYSLDTITHPEFIICNIKADEYFYYEYLHVNAWRKLKYFIKKTLFGE